MQADRCCCGCLFPAGAPPVHYRTQHECAVLVSLGVAGHGRCWADDDNDLVFETPLAMALSLWDIYRGASWGPTDLPGTYVDGVGPSGTYKCQKTEKHLKNGANPHEI